eukprot:COSAG06_NODE_1365_length_9687_cov_14.601064_1_plen_53_part_00
MGGVSGSKGEGFDSNVITPVRFHLAVSLSRFEKHPCAVFRNLFCAGVSTSVC